MPRSAIGIGMFAGIILGGVAGATIGIMLDWSRPGSSSTSLVLGAFLAGLGIILGAVVGAILNLALYLTGRRKLSTDGPEADYRELDSPEP